MNLIRFGNFGIPGKYIKRIVFAIVAMTFALPSFGQGAALDIDADHSVAELFVGSSSDTYSFSPGYARVMGEMVLNLDAPGKTMVDVHIYPAGQFENGANQMEFLSKRTVLLKDGSLAVTGDLMVTRLERSVTANPGEDYSGPVYGDPVARTVHHRVTFVFDAAKLAEAKRAVTAETRIARKEYPELLSTILSIDWPAVIQNEQCEEGSNGKVEDYAGPKCSGVVLAPNNRIADAGAPGEDYSGIKILPPSGDQVTIRLALQTVRSGETSGAVNGE